MGKGKSTGNIRKVVGALAKGPKKALKKMAYGARVAAAVGRMPQKVVFGAPKMLIDAARGEGMVFPGSKYIGPGNRMNKGTPTDKNDRAAYMHDREYEHYIKKGVKPRDVYTGFSDADKRLMKKADLTKPSGLAVYGGMKVKQLLNKTGLTKRIRDKNIEGIRGKK